MEIVKLIEIFEDNVDPEYSREYSRYSHSYTIDLRKVEIFEKEHEYEYRYIQRIVEAARLGRSVCHASRKFSFSDCPDWYQALLTDEPHEIEIEYEVS